MERSSTYSEFGKCFQNSKLINIKLIFDICNYFLLNFYSAYLFCCSLPQIFTLIGKLQIINDASQGSEKMKTISLYVLDALVFVDDKKYYLQKLQTTGFLRNCIRSLSEQVLI